MVSKQELMEWLASLPADEWIGVDDGGLIIQTASGEQWFEIGGIPAEAPSA